MVIQKNNIIVGMLLALLSLASCQKKGLDMTQSYSPHRVISAQTADAKASNQCFLSTEIGHDGKNCPGCVMYHGEMVHRDCMNHGNYCRVIVNVNLDIVGSNITATTIDTFDLTTEDFFQMPDRSLYYGTDVNNNRIYLNIPAQMVLRDTATQQFTFTGLFFSNTAAYSNN